METTGIIVNINKDTFTVKVDRKSSCGGNCVSCKGCPSETLFLQLKGKYKYSIGDTVILEMPTKNFLFSSFLGYIIPVILSIFGAILGYYFTKNENFSVLGTIIGLILGLILLRIFFKNKKQNIKIKSKV